MDSEIKNLIKVWIVSIASICYCYFLVKHIPKGLTRLISLFPIFYLFLILPLDLHSFYLGGTTFFCLVWLANFKLLLFSFDQGPLSDSLTNPSNTLLHFIYIALLPIKIKQDPHPKSPSNARSNRDQSSNSARNGQRSAFLPIKVLLLAMLFRAYNYRQYLHPYIIWGMYCCNLYLDLEVMLAMAAVLARAILGIELEPQFNEPYLATSLQDFWGQRWNLVVTGILRPTVYGPIQSMSTRMLGRSWAPLPAIMATFLVSGLMHELIFFYLTRVSPTWEVMWFFVLQGVCTAAEVAAKKAVAGRWRLHRVVSGLLTLVFVVVTGVWLFFPQFTRNGLDQKGIEEYQILVDFFMAGVQMTISLVRGLF
ncbi:hypothetical protein RHGRI_018713 [Rhododendron griersonianum]|uniref:Wax synthase domain-containing protein n=1 Tax=Rhododendron griersonianum TaxID=479676 RepID=A0AAV6K2S2_9ERIC|nr:hypothetical protein RHGRI_018713 [Rhododendron griersonianum]